LEEDLALLAAHAQARDVARSGQQGLGEAGVLPFRRWAAVVYRAGQKRVLRAHLMGARRELQRVLRLLDEARSAAAADAASAEKVDAKP
jgi:hypothetical protein